MEISNFCRHNVSTNTICGKCGAENMCDIPGCFVCHPTKDKAKHFDDNKTALQWILSMQGIDDVANVGMYGAKKYGQSNWRLGSEYMRYLGSCVRHICNVIRGQWFDNESGLPHLAHCAFNCLILLEWVKTGKGTDDRPKI